MLKISHAGCFGLSPAIWCNSLLKCVSQPKIVKKFTKTCYFGGSRSFKVINVNISTIVTISCMSVPICNHFHVRRAYNGKITLLRGCPSFALLFEGISFTQQNEILSRNTRNNRLSYGRNPKSVSHLVLDWYRAMTDGQTDRQNYCSKYALWLC